MLEKFLNFDWKLFMKRTYQKIMEIDVSIHAMSLVYTTLLSIIPLLIFSFYTITLFDIFGGTERIIETFKEVILSHLATGTGQIVIDFLEGFIIDIDIGQLGAVSFFSLVLVIIFMLARIEKTFNLIWGVEEHRDLLRRFVAFWTFITLGTFLVTISISLTITLVSDYLGSDLVNLSSTDTFLFRSVTTISYFLLYITGYYLIPNTDVDPFAALVGGLTGGTLFIIARNIYVMYATNALAYHRIYGSLSVAPLFLIWLYVVWMITLSGAVISYVFQHRKNLHHFRNIHDISIGTQSIIPIAFLVVICKEFSDKKSKGIDFEGLAYRINIPVEIIEENLNGLIDEGFVAVSKDGNFIPATTLSKISLWEIAERFIFDQEVEIKDIFADKEIEDLYFALVRKTKSGLQDATIVDLLN
ncbi:YihY/virulence factor BrkB family protein [Halonatronum saccharophilum]|uniref:YihY/virulence factor BrkB family protein n=1 Tax=Halonatronum saccharophilum TaxID=150060 RepID=UPI00048A2273|nr:YhjD/YihY/BrkB family envelope integrity protein [Halonatronum saccharophilum]